MCSCPNWLYSKWECPIMFNLYQIWVYVICDNNMMNTLVNVYMPSRPVLEGDILHALITIIPPEYPEASLHLSIVSHGSRTVSEICLILMLLLWVSLEGEYNVTIGFSKIKIVWHLWLVRMTSFLSMISKRRVW